MPVIPSARSESTVSAGSALRTSGLSAAAKQSTPAASTSRTADKELAAQQAVPHSQRHVAIRNDAPATVQTTRVLSTSNRQPASLPSSTSAPSSSTSISAPASARKELSSLPKSSAPAKIVQRPATASKVHRPASIVAKKPVTAPTTAQATEAQAAGPAVPKKATVKVKQPPVITATKRSAFVAPKRVQKQQVVAQETPMPVQTELSLDWIPSFLTTGHKILGVNISSTIARMDPKSALVASRYTVNRIITLLGSHHVTALLETPERLASILSPVVSVTSMSNGVALVQLANGTSEHILEDNGEVIGHGQPAISNQPVQNAKALSTLLDKEEESNALRPDWTAHIASSGEVDIIECVRSGNEEDYPRGIANLFKSKFHHTREMLAARAYVLSHVAVSFRLRS